MTSMETLQDDLRYVKGALVRREPAGGIPLSIALYWAAAMAIGFPMADFAPARIGLFWMIAGPLGFVYSLLMGHVASRDSGEVDHAYGLRIGLHFGGMMVAIFAAGLLFIGSELSGAVFGRIVLLLLALSYFSAALHLSRRLYFVAAILFAGFVALAFVDTYAWTAIGLLGAAALIAAAVIRREDSAAA